MRVLACTLGGHGFVYPLLRIASALREHGHEVAIVTAPSFADAVSSAGFELLADGRADAGFTVKTWALPDAAKLQVLHIERAAVQFAPDVMIGHMLAHGPFMVAERHRVPLAVLGVAAYLWPRRGRPGMPTHTDAEERDLWRIGESIRLFNQARAVCGLSPVALDDLARHPLQGDRFLVQNVAALDRCPVPLPERAAFGGYWPWSSPSSDPEAVAFVERAGHDGAPLLYVQPGPSFGEVDVWTGVFEQLMRRDVRVVLCASRMDHPLAGLGDRVLVRSHIDNALVLPHARGVIASGHTSSVLAALAAGCPSILIPNGSGTEEISAMAEDNGAAIALDRGDLDGGLDRAMDRLLGDQSLHEGARVAGARLTAEDGADTAAALIAALAAGERSSQTAA